jgi:hypothetical protein
MPMKNEHYDIVSTLYHALQGAETCATFIHDAEKAGDKEAAEFFHEVQDENRKVAMKAQELLARRMH